jgi:spoIIIJ-associated protein
MSEEIEDVRDDQVSDPVEPDQVDATSGTEEEEEPVSLEEVATTGEEFVRGLLDAADLAAEVTSHVDSETAHIEVTGEDLGVMIGRRGQTLDSLQELTRTAVQRKLRSRIRLLVDVEGYRARRRSSLADYARSIAERAKERGTEIELEPMSAYERKIVHDAVSEIDGASSFSEGEEPNRKVVVRGEGE